jgi:hypothetical protein
MLWRMQKNVDVDISWERDAAAAIPMAIPILLLAESATNYMMSWTGLGALAAVADNRIAYALIVFVPVWLVVFLGFRSVNRKIPPSSRLETVFASTTAGYRWTCIVAYFAIPATIFIEAFFF